MHRYVDAPKLQSLQALHCRRQTIRVHIKAEVNKINVVFGERGVVHRRAQAVSDGLPDQGQKPRPTADHPPRHKAMLARCGLRPSLSALQHFSSSAGLAVTLPADTN